MTEVLTNDRKEPPEEEAPTVLFPAKEAET
jgi:hypothetical protein